MVGFPDPQQAGDVKPVPRGVIDRRGVAGTDAFPADGAGVCGLALAVVVALVPEGYGGVQG